MESEGAARRGLTPVPSRGTTVPQEVGRKGLTRFPLGADSCGAGGVAPGKGQHPSEAGTGMKWGCEPLPYEGDSFTLSP